MRLPICAATVHLGSVEPRPGIQVSDRVDQRRSFPMKAGELKASEPPPACFCTVGPRPAGHPQHPQHNEKLAGAPEVLSGSARFRETVEFSSEGPLDNGHTRRYMGVARSRAGDGGSATFCGVHTWQ